MDSHDRLSSLRSGPDAPPARVTLSPARVALACWLTCARTTPAFSSTRPTCHVVARQTVKTVSALLSSGILQASSAPHSIGPGQKGGLRRERRASLGWGGRQEHRTGRQYPRYVYSNHGAQFCYLNERKWPVISGSPNSRVSRLKHGIWHTTPPLAVNSLFVQLCQATALAGRSNRGPTRSFATPSQP